MEKLLDACSKGRSGIVKNLLADPSVDPSLNGSQALVIATSQFFPSIPLIEILLSDPRVDPSVNENAAFIFLAKKDGHPLFLALLADPRVDPAAKNNEAFVNAVSSGCLTNVRHLLSDPRVDPSAVYRKAFIYACNGHLEMVEFMAGCFQFQQYVIEGALRMAYTNYRFDVAEYLVNRFCEADAALSQSAFTMACENGDLKVVKKLIQNPKVDPSAERYKAYQDVYNRGRDEIANLLLTDC